MRDRVGGMANRVGRMRDWVGRMRDRVGGMGNGRLGRGAWGRQTRNYHEGDEDLQAGGAMRHGFSKG